MLYTNHPFLLFFKFILYSSLSNQEKYEINGWKIGEHWVYDILTSAVKRSIGFIIGFHNHEGRAALRHYADQTPRPL